MLKFNRKLIGWIFVVVFWGLGFSFITQTLVAQAETTVTVGISTNRVKFGEFLTLSASGFTPGDQVAFWVTSPEGIASDYATGKVGEEGSFNSLAGKPFVVATPGRWFITAQSLQTGSQYIGEFTLEAPVVTLTAKLAGGEVSLTDLQGSYFYPFERVSFWVTDANGKVTDLGTLVVGKQGDFPGGYSAAFPTSSGGYKLTAYGQTSHSTTVIDVNPN